MFQPDNLRTKKKKKLNQIKKQTRIRKFAELRISVLVKSPNNTDATAVTKVRTLGFIYVSKKSDTARSISGECCKMMEKAVCESV